MYWRDLTYPDFDKIDRRTVVIIPVAAIEQHGKHLPVATDALINQHFLKQLEASISSEVLILPTVEVGYSEHHMELAGSLTVSHSTLIHYLQDIITSVIRHGFYNLILFNSHGGNQGVAQVVCENIGITHKQINLVNLTWWKIIINQLKEIIDGDEMKTGHAGEIETSIILDSHPSLVAQDRMQAGEMQKVPDWAEGNLMQAPSAGLIRTMLESTGNGVFGDPTTANADKGKQITEAMITRLITLIRELAPLKRG